MRFGNACLEDAFCDPQVMVSSFSEALRRAGMDPSNFSTIVGTGFSGALVVPELGRSTLKDYLLIRKPGDSHHHGSAVAEGNFSEDGRWIFVDDGIASGTTYRRVREVMRQLAAANGLPDKFQGVYLYGHDGTVQPRFWTPAELAAQGFYVR